MQYYKLIIFSLLISSCVPSPADQNMERRYIAMAAGVSAHVPVLSAHRKRDITRVMEDKKYTVIISTRYTEPFQSCSKYKTSFYSKKTGFLDKERNYDFKFKVCEGEKKETYIVELLDPLVPGQSGYKRTIDINKMTIDESTIKYD